jgi:hypothetical protein
MFERWRAGGRLHVCPGHDCPHPQYPARELLFVCPCPTCPGRGRDEIPGKPQQWADSALFRPERYAHSAPCPFSPHSAYVKVCPSCWREQPSTGNDTSTIAVVGASISGKTCFVTGLIHQINRELTSETSRRMSLEWKDEKGKKYFQAQEREIFSRFQLPAATKRRTEIETMSVTLRFPVAGWRRWAKGPFGAVSLIFPDPAGEFFENMKNTYFLSYLARARAVILMVDPWMSERYRHQRQEAGDPLDPVEGVMADEALNALVEAIRNGTGQHTGLIRKELAVVLTKCDEEGLFDPDQEPHKIPRQGRFFSRAIAEEISRRTERHLREELGMDNVVTMARNNFRRVAFFAASALGKAPVRSVQNGRATVKLVDPRPRRVEDPLLWIFHRWGYW